MEKYVFSVKMIEFLLMVGYTLNWVFIQFINKGAAIRE